MIKLLAFKRRIAKNEDGATAIEYGLLAALVAVAIIVTVTALGGELNSVFARVETDLNTAENAAGSPADD